jgi:hypothetical protein
MRIEMPDTAAQPFTLQEPVTRSGGFGLRPADTSASIVALSAVASLPLMPGSPLIGNDPELAAFLEHTPRRFHYVRFGCSFEAAAGERFETAFFRVDMRAAGAGDPPIAWSMAPASAYDEVKTTLGAEIDSGLKFISPKISVEREGTRREYSLRAYREGRPDPYWLFTATRAVRIEGGFRLHMVVSGPPDETVEGVITVETRVRGRKFLIVPYEAVAGETPPTRFALSAAD